MRLIFLINYYKPIDKLQIFVKLLLTNKQLILRYQKLNYLISGGFLDGLLCPLLKTDLPLMMNVIKPLAGSILIQSVLIPLVLTTAASASEARIHKKTLGSCRILPSASNNNTILIISNDEMEDIIKIVKSLEDFGLLLKRVSEIIQNEAKEQKGGFFSILPGTFRAILLGNVLAGKGVIRVEDVTARRKQGKEIVRAGYGSKRSSIKKDFQCRIIL